MLTTDLQPNTKASTILIKYCNVCYQGSIRVLFSRIVIILLYSVYFILLQSLWKNIAKNVLNGQIFLQFTQRWSLHIKVNITIS